MANDLNQCTFVGRLGRTPESRTFPNGDMVANVTIAVGSTWKDKATGEKKEKTEWVPVVFTGKLAEIAAQYLDKGSKILVVGEFRTRKWQDQSGQDRYSTEIRADRMQMLDSRQGGGDGGSGDQQRTGGGDRQRSNDGQRQQSNDRQQYGSGQQRGNNGGGQQQPQRANSGFDDMDDDIAF